MADVRIAVIEVHLPVWNNLPEEQIREWVERRLGLGTVQSVSPAENQ